MMNFILASTSTLYGTTYLTYLKTEIKELFSGIDEIVFVPYARPSGITLDAYTDKTSQFFKTLDIQVIGLHQYDDPIASIQNAKGIFTGGGNTFFLVKTLHELGLIHVMKDAILQGTPYLGTSAGSNIVGVNMKTTNDMPIVYPPSFDTMNVIPFNINAHYLDSDPHSTHKGETRETRIKEFLTQNDEIVIGLREGNWIRGKNNALTIEGENDTRIFIQNQEPFEVKPHFNLQTLLDK